MKQNLNFEQVKSFDLLALQKAFEEGRLFIQPEAPSAEAVREEGIRQILQYVSRIDEYATADYRPHIHQIWDDILRDGTLGNMFFYTRYSRNRGEVNWYRVTVMMCLLHEWRVYVPNITSTDLHCILEGTQKRNGRYTGMNRYLFETKYFKQIRAKLQKVQQ